MLRVASTLISVTLAVNPLVGQNCTTQGHCDILVATVRLRQVSPGTH